MRKKGNNKGGRAGGRRKERGASVPAVQFTGRVQMTREGYAFVIVDGQDDDIYVKASKTRHALDGDTVRVAVTREYATGANSRAGQKAPGRRREGEITEIVSRSGRQFVGIYHSVGARGWVLMQSKNMPWDISVDAGESARMGAKRGMKVAAVVDRWDRKDANPSGHLVDVLGMPGENETEMHAILAEFNLPYRFPEEVEKAAEDIPDSIGEEDLKGRRDFRDVLTFTVDPADAKDFDDALSFRKLPGGNYEVGVHIADVSYYVKPGSAVDREARERGTSVYLVDRTVPMLPEKLCNKLCSLRPEEEKLTFSVVSEITPKGDIKNRWTGRTVIRSDYRFDYDQAQEIIESAPAKASKLPVEEAVLELHKLASIFRERRFKAGAVNFERPEMKVEIDENGKPVGVHQHISKESNWLIEEFMLLANRTVAEYVATDGRMNGVASKNPRTFVYRIHGEPNEEKLASLAKFAGNFGYKLGDVSWTGKDVSRNLNALLLKAEGKPEKAAFEDIALRAMAKACYSTGNIGHYGLAFRFYTHFTSPIRRYPDLMVHRLLGTYLAGGRSQDRNSYEAECEHASDRELVAADAERTSIKYKLVEFMQDKIGEEYDGRISGITDWGMYVQIEPTMVEGMVALREIRSDFFEFDEEHYRLVGRRTRKVFRLGDPVRIRVKSANLEQRLLDYALVEDR